jgi:drug/metabolite transporter (DMT)-like permease
MGRSLRRCYGAAIMVGRHLSGRLSREAALRGRDWGWMALVVATGGVAGPILLMLGLGTIPASSAALLLNLEGLANPCRRRTRPIARR